MKDPYIIFNEEFKRRKKISIVGYIIAVSIVLIIMILSLYSGSGKNPENYVCSKSEFIEENFKISQIGSSYHIYILDKTVTGYIGERQIDAYSKDHVKITPYMKDVVEKYAEDPNICIDGTFEIKNSSPARGVGHTKETGWKSTYYIWPEIVVKRNYFVNHNQTIDELLDGFFSILYQRYFEKEMTNYLLAYSILILVGFTLFYAIIIRHIFNSIIEKQVLKERRKEKK